MRRVPFAWVVFTAAVAVFAGTLEHYLVSDDFLNLERAMRCAREAVWPSSTD